ncbi:oxidoreductase [Streptomyces sp. MMG1533]|uniref:SDR family NAD(P)-dependent oxidoreductase n=1 Tax=Streptomyces sp. MMG1533 TaxID=1415546 RepID=UPI0006AE9572|nr:SDR family oxidoreductase [Streptomyces sp. MMG1533]KOU59807.1 oxidoreductase [Streptomyces sp. MMG1533]
MRLQGKVAVVTGTSPRIGGTIARGFAAEGAKVACTSLSADEARTCAEEIVSAGGEAFPVVGDVTDPAHAQAVVEQVLERWGRVDVLVNNAVWFNRKGLLTVSLEEYRHQLDVILTGAFLFTRAVAEAMIRTGTGGSVINILSGAAFQGEPGNLGYCAGKSGLLNFTRSVAMELAGHGIRVNGFTPTVTLPDDPEAGRRMLSATASQDRPYPMDFAGQFPLGRLPTAADYLPALVFLASDESRMVTGGNIAVDGGVSAKYWAWQPRHAD